MLVYTVLLFILQQFLCSQCGAAMLWYKMLLQAIMMFASKSKQTSYLTSSTVKSRICFRSLKCQIQTSLSEVMSWNIEYVRLINLKRTLNGVKLACCLVTHMRTNIHKHSHITPHHTRTLYTIMCTSTMIKGYICDLNTFI